MAEERRGWSSGWGMVGEVELGWVRDRGLLSLMQGSLVAMSGPNTTSWGSSGAVEAPLILPFIIVILIAT